MIGLKWSQFDLRFTQRRQGLHRKLAQIRSLCTNFLLGSLIAYNNAIPIRTSFYCLEISVQVSQDPNFSNIYDSVITNNNCWTPTKGYHDGTYYWHVAMYRWK